MLSLEVVLLPVANMDSAIEFYRDKVGFHLDVDYQPSATFRVVQLTPSGSHCSIHLVLDPARTGSAHLYLVTDDLAAERDRLIQRGIDIREYRHKEPVATWGGGWAPGLDPQRRDYASFAEFSDPDGNRWTLQERGYRAS